VPQKKFLLLMMSKPVCCCRHFSAKMLKIRIFAILFWCINRFWCNKQKMPYDMGVVHFLKMVLSQVSGRLIWTDGTVRSQFRDPIVNAFKWEVSAFEAQEGVGFFPFPSVLRGFYFEWNIVQIRLSAALKVSDSFPRFKIFTRFSILSIGGDPVPAGAPAMVEQRGEFTSDLENNPLIVFPSGRRGAGAATASGDGHLALLLIKATFSQSLDPSLALSIYLW
jgi:hypothetical protein